MSKETLLIFSIGPVQSFIAAARKTEDLWSGSFILSHLTAEAIKKCYRYTAEKELPFELITPYITEEQFVDPSINQKLEIASLPNRFICKVSANEQQVVELAQTVEQYIRKTFTDLGQEAIALVFKDRVITDYLLEQSALQTEQLLEVYWTMQPLEDDFLSARKKLESRLAAVKNAVPFSQTTQNHFVCTICYERDALTNAPFNENASIRDMRLATVEMRQNMTRPFEGKIDEKETMCAVCLMKRAARLFFKETLGQRKSGVFEKFPSIGDITKIKNEEQRYYAAILFDGDNMGKKFSQKQASSAEDIMYQQHISKKLNHYSMEVVPSIIAEHKGALVYSGGDDVLAFLPLENAIPAAKALRQAFADHELGLGKGATLSGSIIVAHEKMPLQYVLEEMRKLEKASKSFTYEKTGTSKNAYTIGVYTNGEIRQFTLPWILPNGDASDDYLLRVAQLISGELSSTFIYTIEQLFIPLIGAKLDGKVSLFQDDALNREMMTNEFQRLISRACLEPNMKIKDIAQKLVALHEVCNNTLQFIHLLETARFFNRKRANQL